MNVENYFFSPFQKGKITISNNETECILHHLPESLTENVSVKHRVFCHFPFPYRCLLSGIGCCETLYVFTKLTRNKNETKI